MRLKCQVVLHLAVIAVVLAVAGTAAAESIIAYYPFESGVPGGTTPDEYSDNDLTIASSYTSIDSAGMFGNTLKTTNVLGNAQLAADDPDLDVNFAKLSVSLWAKASTWTDTQFGGRYLTGKYSTGTNVPPTHGWNMNVKADRYSPVIHQIEFGGYNTSDTASQWLQTSFDTALDAEIFHHIVGTFDGSGDVCIYVDGILAASAPAQFTELLGDNADPFQVSNRGVTATNPNSGGGFIGSIDDYLIASGDVLSAQQVALTHGLGRLAGVSMGDGTTVGGEINDVLAAYNAQGSATAGGQSWSYMSNVGGGTTVGTIGGSVAGGDAYIVLGADGSGVMMVPEPGMLVMLLSSVIGLLLWRRQ